MHKPSFARLILRSPAIVALFLLDSRKGGATSARPAIRVLPAASAVHGRTREVASCEKTFSRQHEALLAQAHAPAASRLTGEG